MGNLGRNRCISGTETVYVPGSVSDGTQIASFLNFDDPDRSVGGLFSFFVLFSTILLFFGLEKLSPNGVYGIDSVTTRLNAVRFRPRLPRRGPRCGRLNYDRRAVIKEKSKFEELRLIDGHLVRLIRSRHVPKDFNALPGRLHAFGIVNGLFFWTVVKRARNY